MQADEQHVVDFVIASVQAVVPGLLNEHCSGARFEPGGIFPSIDESQRPINLVVYRNALHLNVVGARSPSSRLSCDKQEPPGGPLGFVGMVAACEDPPALAEMGQSMGVTATGLLLLRVVDPNCKTKAASAFASKQLLHEPFMGGGLWTGMAIPMLVIYGGWHVLIITSIAIAIWSLYLFFQFV